MIKRIGNTLLQYNDIGSDTMDCQDEAKMLEREIWLSIFNDFLYDAGAINESIYDQIEPFIFPDTYDDSAGQ